MIKNYKITSIVTRNIKNGEYFKTQNKLSDVSHIVTGYNQHDTYDEVLSFSDTLYIANKTFAHYDTIKAIFKSYLNKKEAFESKGIKFIIFCEKPLVFRYDQAVEIYKFVKKHKIWFFVTYKTNKLKIYRKLEDFVARIGDIVNYQFMKSTLTESNYKSTKLICDLYYYCLMMAISLFGKIRVEKIKSLFSYKTEKNVYMFSIIQHWNMITGTFYNNFSINMNDYSYIYGTKGFVQIDSVSSLNNIKLYNYNLYNSPKLIDEYNAANKRNTEENQIRELEIFKNQFEHFNSILEKNDYETCLKYLETDIHSIEVMEKIENDNLYSLRNDFSI